MILVIDSGATQTKWKFLSTDSSENLVSEGFNLATHPIPKLQVPDSEWNDKVERIFYFGAGTSLVQKKQALEAKLKEHFPSCLSLFVGSDIYTACYALWEKGKDIISIHGTGSNACIFDGKEITATLPSMGYILGDLGSGFHFGKTVINDYFLKNMPAEDQESFATKYRLKHSKLISDLYSSDIQKNTYIAQYSKFLIDASPYYREKVASQCLDAYFQSIIKSLQGYDFDRIQFSGSIAFHFKDIIYYLCEKYKFEVGNIIRNPIESLTYEKLQKI